LYPGLLDTIKIVEKQMKGENQKRAGEQEEAETDDEEGLSDSDEEARFFL
jgi:hypothetical protein